MPVLGHRMVVWPGLAACRGVRLSSRILLLLAEVAWPAGAVVASRKADWWIAGCGPWMTCWRCLIAGLSVK